MYAYLIFRRHTFKYILLSVCASSEIALAKSEIHIESYKSWRSRVVDYTTTIRCTHMFGYQRMHIRDINRRRSRRRSTPVIVSRLSTEYRSERYVIMLEREICRYSQSHASAPAQARVPTCLPKHTH